MMKTDQRIILILGCYRHFIGMCKAPKEEQFRKDKNKLEMRWTHCDASSQPLTR